MKRIHKNRINCTNALCLLVIVFMAVTVVSFTNISSLEAEEVRVRTVETIRGAEEEENVETEEGTSEETGGEGEIDERVIDERVGGEEGETDERIGGERIGGEQRGDERIGGERIGGERRGDERIGGERRGDERIGGERRGGVGEADKRKIRGRVAEEDEGEEEEDEDEKVIFPFLNSMDKGATAGQGPSVSTMTKGYTALTLEGLMRSAEDFLWTCEYPTDQEQLPAFCANGCLCMPDDSCECQEIAYLSYECSEDKLKVHVIGTKDGEIVYSYYNPCSTGHVCNPVTTNCEKLVTIAEATTDVAPKTVYAKTTTPQEPNFLEVAAADFPATCAITRANDPLYVIGEGDGRLFCWGKFDYGVGAPILPTNTSNKPIEVQIIPYARLTSLVAGSRHFCAIDENKEVWCWGSNLYGQLGVSNGIGGIDQTAVPQKVPGLTNVKNISAHNHTCAVTTNNEVYCWGLNDWGQLGYETPGSSSTSIPTKIEGVPEFKKVAAGANHSCALKTNNDVWCWGNNEYWQTLGIDPEKYPNYQGPGPFPPHSLFLPTYGEDIVASDYKSRAVNSSGKISRWGVFSYTATWGSDGMLNITPLKTKTNYKTSMSQIGNVSSISASKYGTCAIGSPKKGAQNLYAYCWGVNTAGQIGRPVPAAGAPFDEFYFYDPHKVWNENGSPVGDFIGPISMGTEHTCAINNTFGVMCWGRNHMGQLGDGTNVNTSSPSLVKVLP